MKATAREIVVLGGGISGLTAAWHLKKAGVDVCLLEANPTVGGCTRTEKRDGFLLEKGPFNVIIRDPAFEALLQDVSDEVKVITASRSARLRYIYRRGRLHPLPTNPVALATTKLLSIQGRLRLLARLFVSLRGGDREETIEQAAIRRFGKEVSDTIVSAAIAGIHAGDIRKLSLKACFPTLARIDAQSRSLLAYGLISAFRGVARASSPWNHRQDAGATDEGAALPHHLKRGKRRWRGLVSFDGGLGALTAALGRRLGSDLLSNCRVEGIRTVNGDYEVKYRTSAPVENRCHTMRRLRCRNLVIASPVAEASRLLQPLLPNAAAILNSIKSISLVVLNLGFRRTDVGHPMEGFGFLVPHNEPDFPLMGALWADSVFPHHAPPDHRLMRIFIGGARDLAVGSAVRTTVIERTDEELVAAATDALQGLLRLRADPVLVDVCRYRAAIPQYHLGHREKINRLRAAVATYPGLHLIGNYLEGISLNDCVRLATDIANNIIQSTRSLLPPLPRGD